MPDKNELPKLDTSEVPSNYSVQEGKSEKVKEEIEKKSKEKQNTDKEYIPAKDFSGTQNSDDFFNLTNIMIIFSLILSLIIIFFIIYLYVSNPDAPVFEEIRNTFNF
jgi:hypothetical protein